jgi:hypothetical protein
VTWERRTPCGTSLSAETSKALQCEPGRYVSQQLRPWQDGAFVPDDELGSGVQAIAELVAMSPLEKFLNPIAPGGLA